MSPLIWATLCMAAPLSELPRSEREVMALVVRAPGLTGERRSETLEVILDGIEAHTPFRVEDLSEQLRESDDPLASITTAVARAYRKIPELVLALSVLEAPGSENAQVTWQLIRAKEAVVLRDQSESAGAESPDLSRCIEAFDLFEISQGDLGALRDRLLAGLSPPLSARGYWRERGTLIVRLPSPGFTVRTEHRDIALDAGDNQIDDMQAGLRELQLIHPNFEPLRESVRIEPKQTTTWSPQLVDSRLVELQTPRTLVLVSGVGLFAAGAAFVAIAVGQAAADSPRCLTLPGEPPCGTADQTFARLGPIPTAPLGYSLALAGGILAGGILVSEETAEPWWWTALGIGLGAAAFTVSTIAD